MSLSRRKFITSTAQYAGGAAILPALDALDLQAFNFSPAPGYSLHIYATSWGFEGSLDLFCQKSKAAGYDGIEVWCPGSKEGRDELLVVTKKHGLSFGLLVGGGNSDPAKHFTEFKTSLAEAVKLQPVYINCHSGRDFFSLEQNRPFIELTTQSTAATGVPIYHETHRARILFAAHISKQYLETFPALRLTLDISHWCNVHHSFLEDQKETVELALTRTDHIHARVGHDQGPQVNDPRAPEWANALKAHFAWWDTVVKYKSTQGKPLTMLAEFGPPSYMPTVPYTQMPLANQWEINAHMMKLWRERYAK
jgi:sugar phosphate isomerase/epimerase